jgi:hypothetical protein
MKTGAAILTEGLYANDCCLVRIEFVEDIHPFPRCPRCGRECIWGISKTDISDPEAT